MAMFMCSNVGCGEVTHEKADRCEACGWPMRELTEPSSIPDSPTSDPDFDSDPDDGGD